MKRVSTDRQPASAVRCKGIRWPGYAEPAAAYLLRLTVLVAVTGAAGASLIDRAGAEEKQGPKPMPRGFDEATAAAWKKAGAEIIWMGKNKDGRLKYDMQPDGLEGAVPVCWFKHGQEKLLAGLPDPAIPFGLDLFNTKATDAGLKGLAGLKSLQVLNLRATQ